MQSNMLALYIQSRNIWLHILKRCSHEEPMIWLPHFTTILKWRLSKAWRQNSQTWRLHEKFFQDERKTLKCNNNFQQYAVKYAGALYRKPNIWLHICKQTFSSVKNVGIVFSRELILQYTRKLHKMKQFKEIFFPHEKKKLKRNT